MALFFFSLSVLFLLVGNVSLVPLIRWCSCTETNASHVGSEGDATACVIAGPLCSTFFRPLVMKGSWGAL